MGDAKPRKPRMITSEHIDETLPAPRIVAKCGGLTAFCRMMGFPTSTVHRQMKNGFFPNRLHPSGMSIQAYIIERAREHGITITPADFIEGEVAAA